MATFVCLGGTLDANSDALEQKIFRFFHLRSFRLLFFPQAEEQMDTAVSKFLKRMHLEEPIDVVTEDTDVISLRKKIEKADVLYFGGGHILTLLNRIRFFNYLPVLEEFLTSDKIFMGISAGAILFSYAGLADHHAYRDAFRVYRLEMVEGLHWIPYTICPHYDHEGRISYNDEVAGYPVSGIALEDGTAVIFEADTVKVMKASSQKSVYLFDLEKNFQMLPLYKEG